jgi:hypothetical protein
MEENCPLDRTSIIPIKRAHDFCTEHVEISTLSTDAIQPLTRIKDVNVLENVVAALKILIDAGKKPKRRDVVTCIQNERLTRRSTSEIKIQQNEKKILQYQEKIRILQQENELLRNSLPTESLDDSLNRDSFGVTEESGSIKTIGYAAARAKLANKTLVGGS